MIKKRRTRRRESGESLGYLTRPGLVGARKRERFWATQVAPGWQKSSRRSFGAQPWCPQLQNPQVPSLRSPKSLHFSAKFPKSTRGDPQEVSATSPYPLRCGALSARCQKENAPSNSSISSSVFSNFSKAPRRGYCELTVSQYSGTMRATSDPERTLGRFGQLHREG